MALADHDTGDDTTDDEQNDDGNGELQPFASARLSWWLVETGFVAESSGSVGVVLIVDILVRNVLSEGATGVGGWSTHRA